MTRKYTVLYETGPNSVGAHVRELPGCIAVGETREEAEELIQEAITMHLEAMQHELPDVPEAVIDRDTDEWKTGVAAMSPRTVD